MAANQLSNNQIVQPDNPRPCLTEDQKQLLKDKCADSPYLDGHFFEPDIDNSSLEAVTGLCKLCPVDGNGKPKKIKGKLHPTSNFRTHLLVMIQFH